MISTDRIAAVVTVGNEDGAHLVHLAALLAEHPYPPVG